MRNAQHPGHISLNTLVSKLREGQYVIPDFQREFEWHPRDISDLMRSIFLDYYIGSLLLWKGKRENFEALSCEDVYGYEGNESNKQYIVLDGQQRLTAIHYAFVAPKINLPKRSNPARYYMKVDRFMAEEYDEAFSYEFLSSQKWQRIFSDRKLQFAFHIFPMSTIGADGWALPNWVQGYERFWAQRANSSGDATSERAAQRFAKDARKFSAHLESITGQYQISYIELDEDIEVDKVCDIFTQINSKGVRLDIFDLLNALLKPKGIQLKEMWRNAEPRLSFVDTDKMNVYILQVMSILRQAYCSPKYLYFLLPGQKKPVRDADGKHHTEVLMPDANAFEKSWVEAVSALEGAIQLLCQPQEFGVVSSSYLPYVSILPVFAALQSHAKSLPAELRLRAQRKIRYWYWASVFDGRYSGAVESTSARDFLDVKDWFQDDEATPRLIQEFKDSFKSLNFSTQRSRGTSLYKGVFNLLAIQGAKDWVSGNIPLPEELDDHHIIPASWGNKHLATKEINTILNRTPLTAETNRKVIRDRLPNEYLPEWFAANGEETVKDILKSHLISPAAVEILLRVPFTPEDFRQFITERQQTIRAAIESLLIKERIDLDPSLRELDERLEQVELRLRSLVRKTLDDDFNLVPQRVQNSVSERIERAVKKNAALDDANYENLSQKLEFFDLRELQTTMEGKQLWPRFEAVFKNKTSLLTKFNQLAELRNSLRHSRTVTDIVKKEGEASIIWFSQILKI